MTTSKVLQVITAVLLFSTISTVAFANSLEVDGPGFKVQNRTGWFGRHSTNYQDALGNGVSRSTGFFGRTTTRTRVFGTEAYQRGRNISVTAADGSPMITSHRGLFGIGGRNTRIDGNNIIHSFKGLFNSTPSIPPNTP